VLGLGLGSVSWIALALHHNLRRSRRDIYQQNFKRALLTSIFTAIHALYSSGLAVSL
jgi:hypothetical protein